MLSDKDLQRWLALETTIQKQLGRPPQLDDILFYIGIIEAGLPPKAFTEYERMNVINMAECTVLVPARIYQLYWVEDSGWPHYSLLERLPVMSAVEREDFLKPYILQYAEKHRMF